MYKSEDLWYSLAKVGIKALVAPPTFKNSDYYATLSEIIPELATYPEGKSNINTNTFPKLRHIIIFDAADRAFRLVLTSPTENDFSGAWKYTDVIRFGTDEDRRKLAKVEKNVQPDDPVNIQYTSVSSATSHTRPIFVGHYREAQRRDLNAPQHCEQRLLRRAPSRLSRASWFTSN